MCKLRETYKMKNIKGAMRRNLGYTIDQTILIVAVIAVLITLIIASVWWDLLSRAGGTKLASYFKQIENANSQFFAKMNVWPHDAMNQAGVGARRNAQGFILTLKDRDASYANAGAGVRFFNNFQDYLPGFSVNDVANPTEVRHTFGNGGVITQVEVAPGANLCPGSSDFLRVTMAAVPEAEILQADENIDNNDGQNVGRLRWTNPVNGVADVSYCANNTNVN